jgi:hypothetical protein
MWYDAHEINYTRTLIFSKPSIVDFSGFLASIGRLLASFPAPVAAAHQSVGREKLQTPENPTIKNATSPNKRAVTR